MNRGLEAVRDAGAAGRVLYMLAGWGIRRSQSGAADGFCFNEVTKAVSLPSVVEKQRMLVVGLSTCTPPSVLVQHNLEFFDVRDAIPEKLDPTMSDGGLTMDEWEQLLTSTPRFQAKISAIVGMLELGVINAQVAGGPAALRPMGEVRHSLLMRTTKVEMARER